MLLMNLIASLAFSAVISAAPYVEHRKEDRVKDTEFAGGPHGTDFNDFSFVDAQSGHRRISKITIGPCDGGDLSYMRFEFKDWQAPWKPVTVVEHGGIDGGKKTQELDLMQHERITTVAMESRKLLVGLKYKTRITKITFATDLQLPLVCGSDGNKPATVWSSESDRAFLYFSGAAGNSIDRLIGHTIPRTDY